MKNSTVHRVSRLALDAKHHHRHSFVAASNLTRVRQGAFALAFLALVDALLRLERLVHKVVHLFNFRRHFTKGGMTVEQGTTLELFHHLVQRVVVHPSVNQLEKNVIVMIAFPFVFAQHFHHFVFESGLPHVVVRCEQLQSVVHQST